MMLSCWSREELSSQKSWALELQRRLDAALKNGSSKEGLCEQLRAQLRSREVELEKSKEEAWDGYLWLIRDGMDISSWLWNRIV